MSLSIPNAGVLLKISIRISVALGLICGLNGLSHASAQMAGSRANLSLVTSNVAMTQSSSTEWNLAKTGTVNAANSTVTWQISATPRATAAGKLMINGAITISNSGAG